MVHERSPYGDTSAPERLHFSPQARVGLMWREFSAHDQFDPICFARSPEHRPATCDAIFDAIRELFIDELALARWSSSRRAQRPV